MPTNTHPPVDLRNRIALARAGQPEPVDLARLDRLRALPQQPLVDHAPQRRTHRAPDGDRGKPGKRATDRATNGRARDRKQDRRHQMLSFGNSNRATMRLRQGRLSGLSTTPCPE